MIRCAVGMTFIVSFFALNCGYEPEIDSIQESLDLRFGGGLETRHVDALDQQSTKLY